MAPAAARRPRSLSIKSFLICRRSRPVTSEGRRKTSSTQLCTVSTHHVISHHSPICRTLLTTSLDAFVLFGSKHEAHRSRSILLIQLSIFVKPSIFGNRRRVLKCYSGCCCCCCCCCYQFSKNPYGSYYAAQHNETLHTHSS